VSRASDLAFLELQPVRRELIVRVAFQIVTGTRKSGASISVTACSTAICGGGAADRLVTQATEPGILSQSARDGGRRIHNSRGADNTALPILLRQSDVQSTTRYEERIRRDTGWERGPSGIKTECVVPVGVRL
jgi:hypothetical protein